MLTATHSLQTYASGQVVDLLYPDASTIDILDIAHSLSNLCRYGGHVPAFYSVAQHSVLVAEFCTERFGREAGRWGLLHDASEAYLGDVVWPLKKQAEMSMYREVEDRMMKVIAGRFGLSGEMPEIVEEADRRVLLAEVRDLRGNPGWAQERVGGNGLTAWPSEPILPLSPKLAKKLFLRAWRWLENGAW